MGRTEGIQRQRTPGVTTLPAYTALRSNALRSGLKTARNAILDRR